MKSKKVWKWFGFLSAIFGITAVVIAVPFIASNSFFTNYRQSHADEYEALRYQIPKDLGSAVSESAFAYASNSDRISLYPGDNQKFQDDIENTWLFAGGNDFFSTWDENRNFKNLVGLFEENVRFTITARGGNDPSAPYSSLGRFVINISKPNQTLKDINDNYDFKVKNLDPKNIVVVIGSEYALSDNIDNVLDQFENDLRTFVNRSLELRNNTSNLLLIKHWKVPNPNNDPAIEKFNNNVSKLNIRANRILSELTSKQIPRVLLVDDEDLFLNLPYDYNTYLNADYTLTRVGGNEVAKSLFIALKPYNAVSQKDWVTANWTDFSKTHLDAVPMDWNTLKEKNDLPMKVSKIDVANDIANLTVQFPEGGVADGQSLRWIFEYTNLGTGRGQLRVEDNSVVVNNQITVDNINVYTSTSAGADFGNEFTLTVYDDANGNVFDVFDGDLTKPLTDDSKNVQTTADETPTEVDAKTRFLNKFNDNSKPLVWNFIGDSLDHGALFNQGFDNFPEAVAKSVTNDWKRYDDIFINSAQSGNFTNRAVDPYQIESTITKYKADIVSIGLGVSDGVQGRPSNGQETFTNKQQFQNNMKTLINAAIKANPDAIVVINAVNPTNYADRTTFPAIYNGYLTEMFNTEANNPLFKNHVIYNSDVFTTLKNFFGNFPYTYNDQLFFGSDSLHPSGNGNMVKARTFLKALGIDIENSYISNYMLEDYLWYTGVHPTKPKTIQPIKVVSAGNKAVPDFKTWVSSGPTQTTSSNVTQNVGNIFLNFEKADGRTYYLVSEYLKENNLSTFGTTFTNSYVVLLEPGDYKTSAWAAPKVNMFGKDFSGNGTDDPVYGSRNNVATKAPDGEVKITGTTTS